MRRLLLVVLLLVGLGPVLDAQTTPIPLVGGERAGFTQAAPDLATAQAYRYRLYVDGVRPATGVAAVCTGTVSPFACDIPIPTLTVGVHALTFTAALVLDASTQVESVQSASLSVQMLANGGVPSAPTLPRIIRLP